MLKWIRLAWDAIKSPFVHLFNAVQLSRIYGVTDGLIVKAINQIAMIPHESKSELYAAKSLLLRSLAAVRFYIEKMGELHLVDAIRVEHVLTEYVKPMLIEVVPIALQLLFTLMGKPITPATISQMTIVILRLLDILYFDQLPMNEEEVKERLGLDKEAELKYSLAAYNLTLTKQDFFHECQQAQIGHGNSVLMHWLVMGELFLNEAESSYAQQKLMSLISKTPTHCRMALPVLESLTEAHKVLGLQDKHVPVLNKEVEQVLDDIMAVQGSEDWRIQHFEVGAMCLKFCEDMKQEVEHAIVDQEIHGGRHHQRRHSI